MALRLEIESATTLDANGDGTVSLGPVPSAQIWRVRLVTVQVTPLVLMPSAEVYKASGTVPGTLLGATFLGGRDSSEMAHPVELQPSELLRVEWTGGDPFARAVAYLLGEQDVW